MTTRRSDGVRARHEGGTAAMQRPVMTMARDSARGADSGGRQETDA